MDRGTSAVHILRNQHIPLRLGYVAMVNRSQEDINKAMSVPDARKWVVKQEMVGMLGGGEGCTWSAGGGLAGAGAQGGTGCQYCMSTYLLKDVVRT
jgi:hypothetical protein